MKSCYCQAVIIKWLIAGLCGLLLWSCGGTEERSLRVFRYNSTNTIASLDPAFAKSQEVIWAVKQLYNTLVEPDSNLVIRPSLAGPHLRTPSCGGGPHRSPCRYTPNHSCTRAMIAFSKRSSECRSRSHRARLPPAASSISFQHVAGSLTARSSRSSASAGVR